MAIYINDLILYCGALVVLFLTPGPVWLALSARAISGGFQAAWPLALGVAIGDIIWPLVAILGITWILSVFDTFMLILRWIACAVFLFMGWALVRHANQSIPADNRLTRPGMWAGFLAGLMAILGNPKAVLFYMGVLPGFFDLRNVTAIDMFLIVLASVSIPLMGNMIMAACVGRIRGAMLKPKVLKYFNIGSGVLLIIVGLLIAIL